MEHTAEKFNHNKSDMLAHIIEANTGVSADHSDADYGTGVRPQVDPEFDWTDEYPEIPY